MKKFITYTYITDGSSDRILKYPIQWLLNLYCKYPTSGCWADLKICTPKKTTLSGKITQSITNYPCDILFIHRDAESLQYNLRINEITNALKNVINTPPAVCIVPVRMTEAWFLFDEQAIRKASNNPHSKSEIQIPNINEIENIINPKNAIYNLLILANNAKGRHAKKFKPNVALHRLAEIIPDYSPLFNVPSFNRFKNELFLILKNNNWHNLEI